MNELVGYLLKIIAVFAERLCPPTSVQYCVVVMQADLRINGASCSVLILQLFCGQLNPFCSAFVDLNRDFPDPMLLGYNNLSASGREQPETLAMMKWSKSRHFVASASMHEVAF